MIRGESLTAAEKRNAASFRLFAYRSDTMIAPVTHVVYPAWPVRSNLNDPRRIPYLLVWKDERHDGRIMEAVRMACYSPGPHVELKRTNGSITVLRIVSRMLPRNGGQALFLLCRCCDTPRRFVYGWEWDSFSGWSTRVSISWRCRSCAQLRYSPEGGYLRGSGRGAIAAFFRASFGNLPAPESWLPYVFFVAARSGRPRRL
jgi:hypothetical protein